MRKIINKFWYSYVSCVFGCVYVCEMEGALTCLVHIIEKTIFRRCVFISFSPWSQSSLCSSVSKRFPFTSQSSEHKLVPNCRLMRRKEISSRRQFVCVYAPPSSVLLIFQLSALIASIYIYILTSEPVFPDFLSGDSSVALSTSLSV